MGKAARSFRRGGMPSKEALELEREILSIKFDDADDVSGGGTTQTISGQIIDFIGGTVAVSHPFELASFIDPFLTLESAAPNPLARGNLSEAAVALTGTWAWNGTTIISVTGDTSQVVSGDGVSLISDGQWFPVDTVSANSITILNPFQLTIPTGAGGSNREEGFILAGSGSAATKILTNELGRFSALSTITSTLPGTLYFGVKHTFGSPISDARLADALDSVTYTP